jgi:5-methyltetrahydropteroyltriglutamate--homocysteine methyltransferase
MSGNVDRILTTHVGSLPRPQEVADLLFAQDRGEAYDTTQFDAAMRRGVDDAIEHQARIGIDIVSDGEMSKISYATYIRHRLNGFEGDSPRPTPQDIDEIPEYRDKLVAEGSSAKYRRPVCKGPITIKDMTPLRDDIARMTAALAKVNVADGFMNAVSPGTIAVFQPNEYYPSFETYLEALAEVMHVEYAEIVKAGLILSIDCPDLAMGRHTRFRHLSDDEFVRNTAIQVEAMNHALKGIPADRVRLHVCWGNYEGPHTCDMPLTRLLPAMLKANVGALLIEGANPRHEHEYEVWETWKLPDDKIIVPGVLDSSCNFVEHPELVAQRLIRFANLVGRERVQAGTDCGFGTFAGFGPVHPKITWEKLKAMVEGAAIASDKLWKGGASAKRATAG